MRGSYSQENSGILTLSTVSVSTIGWKVLQEKCLHVSCVHLGNTITSSEKAMAPHSSTLAWKIPWMEEPGRLQSMGSLWVGHDWKTSFSLFTFMHWRRKWQSSNAWNLLQCSCLENPRDGGAWWPAIYRVTKSWTQLKWLSSSSSSTC